MAVPKALLSSVRSDWRTPVPYIEAARTVMGGIDLDPASSKEANKTVQAWRYFDIDINGLCQPWDSRTVFLNPPYGFLNAKNQEWHPGDTGKKSAVDVWISKLLHEYDECHVSEAILLVNNTTEAGWFQRLWDFPICFTDHRIKFVGEGKQPTRGNAFVYLPPFNQEKLVIVSDYKTYRSQDVFSIGTFRANFEQFGHIAT